MKKTAVVYWSGTGNTEAMAQAVLAGMKEAGADAALYTPGEVTPDALSGCTAVAFGCPAMGAEVLEEMEFEPMFSTIKGILSGKRIALFGSYGWGSGEWMHNWEQDCCDSGLSLCCESVICCGAPDESAMESLRAMGRQLAE